MRECAGVAAVGFLLDELGERTEFVGCPVRGILTRSVCVPHHSRKGRRFLISGSNSIFASPQFCKTRCRLLNQDRLTDLQKTAKMRITERSPDQDWGQFGWLCMTNRMNK